MIKEKYELIIIGAGICGLSIGKALTNSSIHYKIVEKSKAFGGRAATRRVSSQPVDHGAQYFTCENPLFRTWIRELEEEGFIKVWDSKFHAWDGKSLHIKDDFKARFICPLGMTSMAKEMAKVLPVSREVKITEAKYINNSWNLKTDGLLELQAEKIISTAPLTQSLEVFADYIDREQLPELSAIEYNPCLCGIFIFPITFKPAWKGIFWNSGEILSWVAHDSSKRDHPHQTVLVAQARPQFSRKHFNANDDATLQKMFEELKTALGQNLDKPLESQLKKWRYSQIIEPLQKPFVECADGNLILTGDWCQGSRIETTYLTGLKVAQKFL